jgi:hypothetical protein
MGLRSKRRSFTCIFQVVESLSICRFLVLLSQPTLPQTVPVFNIDVRDRGIGGNCPLPPQKKNLENYRNSGKC